ncbi:MAG: RNA-binding S4 domain-containing protein [Oscillospiraceae bacterium]|jgi:ribosome-associated protein|nr:RNA-binding S4 domain-containing protein [Oscillospiraceae bacterium]
MKVKINGVRSVYITGEYIKLDALLKFASIASTGGQAKHQIQSGEIYVGKSICMVRGKKIRPGEVIRSGKDIILVKQADS